MTQKEFEKLSFEECKSLNGEHETESVLESWRAGYIYAQSLIRESFQKDYQEDFLDKVELFIEDNLDCFKEWD